MAKKKAPDPCEICPVYRLLLTFASEGEISAIVQHLTQARREVLLAVRSMIDVALAKSEEAGKKAQKIKIE